MGKKITAVFLVIICAGFLPIGWKYIKDSGILRGYPDKGYLSSVEAKYKPVYRQLGRDEQAVYAALYRGISEQKEDIPLPVELDGEDYSRVYCILEKQEARFFYLDSVYYTASKVRDAKIVYRRMNDVQGKQQKLEDAVDEAVRGAGDLYGEEYKVRYINDYIVRNCRYVTGDDEMFASTAYGCLVEGKANCEGYAKAFELLAAEMGLESVVVTGKTDEGENHAWNQVNVAGAWYNIDVTWADTDVSGEMRQMYYLCSDNDFRKTHIADTTLFKPYECGSDDRNYYVRSGLYAESVEDAEKIVRRELQRGNSTIEIRFASQFAYDSFMSEFIDEQNVFDILQESGYEYSGEVTLSLKENRPELCMTLTFS